MAAMTTPVDAALAKAEKSPEFSEDEIKALKQDE